MPTFLRFIRKLRLPRCSICNEPVELETAKTDEDGKAVHEDCYVGRMMRLKEITPPSKASSIGEMAMAETTECPHCAETMQADNERRGLPFIPM